MLDYAEPVTKLIDELQKMPGIGAKSAQRLAFYILRAKRQETDTLVQSIQDVKDKIIFCSVCNNITDVDPCRFCTSPQRDRRVRSEEHTSELQSRPHLVCRLLLEKKKKTKT